MSSTRDRAKQNIPSVVMTLLSIIQALALAAFWDQLIVSYPNYLQWSPRAVLGWLQIITSFLLIILIWFAYIESVIRLRWHPDILDLIAPLFIGLFQLSIIHNMTVASFGYWLCFQAILTVIIYFLEQRLARRARDDNDNIELFLEYGRATWKTHAGFVSPALLMFSCGIWFLNDPTAYGYMLIVAACCLIYYVLSMRVLILIWHSAMAK